VRLRSVLYAVAIVFAAAVFFVLVGLGAIVFLAQRNCGAPFGYYGCETPVADEPADGDHTDHVARARDPRRR
jgi:hypothetical protein